MIAIHACVLPQACLCLSQCYYALSNLSKARAFITTAKTEALKMYTPPDLQAQLDLQSGESCPAGTTYLQPGSPDLQA